MCHNPGSGKTTLAVHWAHRVADRFPDCQLHVNLRRFDPGGRQLSPADAVRGFLDALDTPPERVPPGLDAPVGLYRSLVAGRRDAGTAGQRPRRRPGAAAAARCPDLPGGGDQPQPAGRPRHHRPDPPASAGHTVHNNLAYLHGRREELGRPRTTRSRRWPSTSSRTR